VRNGKKKTAALATRGGAGVQSARTFWQAAALPSGAAVRPDGSLTFQVRRVKRGVIDARAARPLHSPDFLKKLGATPKAASSPLGNNMSVDEIAIESKGAAMPRSAGLADCSLGFAKAITNPFGSFDELPCVPATPPVESYKFRTYRRGTFTTGSAGWGYVAVAPFVPSSDTNKIFSTGAGFTLAKTSNFALSTATAGVVVQGDTSLPFTSAAFTGGIQARLVGCGLRVRNISQAMNVGGILAVVQLADDNNVSSFNGNGLETFADTLMIPQVLQDQNAWTCLMWRPLENSSLDWLPDTSLAATQNATMVISATAPQAATTQTFEWEMVSFWEFAGQSSSQNLPATTRSDADSVGLDRVLTASQRLPMTGLAEDWAAQMAHGVVDAMAHSDSAAKTVEDLVGGGGLSLGKIAGLVGELASFLLL